MNRSKDYFHFQLTSIVLNEIPLVKISFFSLKHHVHILEVPVQGQEVKNEVKSRQPLDQTSDINNFPTVQGS